MAVGLSLAPKLYGYVLLGGGALLAAVVAQLPSLAALGLPALLFAVVGLVLDERTVSATVTAAMSPGAEVVHAGDRLGLEITLNTARRVDRCRVRLALPEGAESADEPYFVCGLRPGEDTTLVLDLLVRSPGALSLGPLVAVLDGPAGLLERRLELGSLSLSVRPAEERLRSLPRSSRVRVPVGDRLARSRGEGIELAEIRPELPGERSRRLNWRATARRQEPHVTMHHPEQSTDVILFVDTFESPELRRGLEVAATAAAAYLAGRDRVGLVCFGGVLDWVEASSGRHQLDRIRSRLAATSPFFSYAWKTIDRIPSRAVPSGGLVLAFSPLRDDRFVSAVGQLRARGHEVIVVDLSAPPADVVPGDPPAREAALRLLEMEREDLRRRLWLRGVAVAPLPPTSALEAAFAGVNEVRRRMRPGGWR